MINPRRLLGRLKYFLLEDLPYRRLSARVPEMRSALADQIARLPALPEMTGHEVEVHMLCGHRDVSMGIFASWSLLRFLEGKGMLYVHCDGSLTEQDISTWAGITPGLVVISKQEADQRVGEALDGKTKYLYQWRCDWGVSAQVVDAHFFGQAPKIVSFDTDVLAFRRPDQFISSILSDVPEFTWCQDMQNAYFGTLTTIKEVLGIDMPHRFNGGCMVTPRLDEDSFREIDELMMAITEDGRIDRNHYWAAQSYYAVLAARRGLQNRMPATYDTHKGRTRKDSVLRHYVGIPQIRYRYFTEGIPKLLQQVK